MKDGKETEVRDSESRGEREITRQGKKNGEE